MSSDATHSGRPARCNLILALALAAVGCGCDLWSKNWVFSRLGLPEAEGNVWWIWPEYIGLETSINTGALFGMGQGRVHWLALISVLANGGVLWWLIWGGASRDCLLSLALGLILGGILGNLYDRMGFWGEPGVRDWILLRYHDFVWPNFNLADSLLVCGAGLMMWHAFRQERHARGASGAVPTHHVDQ